MMLFTKKQLVLTSLAISLFSINGYGQEQIKILSLDTVLNRISQNNLLLESYDLKAESYIHKGEAERSWTAPMVGVGTYMTPYPGVMTMSPSEKGSLMFQIEQVIPGKAKLNAKKRAIQSLSEVEKVNRQIVLNELKAQAKQLYFNGIVANQRIHLLEENQRIMEMMKKIEELRYTYNQGMLGSIYKIEGQLAESRNQVEQQIGNVKRVKAVLNSLMNLPRENRFILDSTFTPTADLQSAYDIADLANRRADVLKIEKSIESVQLDIEALNLQKRPDLTIRFDHMSPLAKGGMPNSYSVMGMISIPIVPWSSKRYASEAKAMHYDVLAMEKEKDATLNRAQGVLAGLKYEIQSTEKQVSGIQEKVIPALQKSFDAYFVNYQENKLELPVVMDAWDALLLMQMNLLNEKLKMYELIIDYEKEIYR